MVLHINRILSGYNIHTKLLAQLRFHKKFFGKDIQLVSEMFKIKIILYKSVCKQVVLQTGFFHIKFVRGTEELIQFGTDSLITSFDLNWEAYDMEEATLRYSI